ncbi:unnamed protein product, partial [Amoebophrya sp. A120]
PTVGDGVTADERVGEVAGAAAVPVEPRGLRVARLSQEQEVADAQRLVLHPVPPIQDAQGAEVQGADGIHTSAATSNSQVPALHVEQESQTEAVTAGAAQRDESESQEAGEPRPIAIPEAEHGSEDAVVGHGSSRGPSRDSDSSSGPPSERQQQQARPGLFLHLVSSPGAEPAAVAPTQAGQASAAEQPSPGQQVASPDLAQQRGVEQDSESAPEEHRNAYVEPAPDPVVDAAAGEPVVPGRDDEQQSGTPSHDRTSSDRGEPAQEEAQANGARSETAGAEAASPLSPVVTEQARTGAQVQQEGPNDIEEEEQQERRRQLREMQALAQEDADVEQHRGASGSSASGPDELVTNQNRRSEEREAGGGSDVTDTEGDGRPIELPPSAGAGDQVASPENREQGHVTDVVSPPGSGDHLSPPPHAPSGADHTVEAAPQQDEPNADHDPGPQHLPVPDVDHDAVSQTPQGEELNPEAASTSEVRPDEGERGEQRRELQDEGPLQEDVESSQYTSDIPSNSGEHPAPHAEDTAAPDNDQTQTDGAPSESSGREGTGDAAERRPQGND